MLVLEYWYLGALLPLAWLVRRWLPACSPTIELRLGKLPSELITRSHRQRVPALLLSFAWLLIVLALARPTWLGEPVFTFTEHRDVMLAVDLSGSMYIEDMNGSQEESISRLSAMKSVLAQFVSQRQGDRLGLVLFADHGYLHTPLTLDITNLEQQISQLSIGLVGYMTAIGEGLAVATKTFLDSDASQRVLILLSDGSNTAGIIDPKEATRLADESGVVIYTIGLGAESMLVETTYGGMEETNPSHDLDEALLTEIADITGGQYFRARNQQELSNVYHLIDELEPIAEAESVWQPRVELYPYPICGFLLVMSLLFIYRRRHG